MKELDERLLEIEVQKRVIFRLDEIRNQFNMHEVAAKLVDKHTFGHIQSRAYLRAWEDMQEILKKELSMGTPFDGDLVRRTWERKEEAVNKISNRLLDNGDYHYLRDKSLINDCIENLIFTK